MRIKAYKSPISEAPAAMPYGRSVRARDVAVTSVGMATAVAPSTQAGVNFSKGTSWRHRRPEMDKLH